MRIYACRFEIRGLSCERERAREREAPRDVHVVINNVVLLHRARAREQVSVCHSRAQLVYSLNECITPPGALYISCKIPRACG